MKPEQHNKKSSPHHQGENSPNTEGFFSNPLAISIFYAAIGFLWIVGTDLLAGYLFKDVEKLIAVEIGKGIFFILAMSGLVYWLAHRVVNNAENRRLQQELELSKNTFDNLVGNMPQGFQVIDLDWRYKFLNDAAVEHARKDREALIGHKMMEVYPGIEETPLFKVLEDCMRNHTSHQLENTFLYPDEEKGEFYLSIFPVAEGVGVISVDTQEITQIQKALEASEDRNKAILSSIGEAILLIDSNSRKIVFANPAVEQVFGYKPEEVINLNTEILHVSRAHFEQFGAIGEPVLEKTGMFVTEYQMKRKDGSVIDTINTVTTLNPGNGWRSGVVSIVRDITAQKKMGADLMESEDRFRSLVTATDQIIWTTTADGQADEPSPSWLAFTGRSREEATGSQWMEAVHPDDRERTAKAWQEAVERNKIFDIEYRLLRHDGEYRYIHVRAVPRYNPDGSVKEWIGSGRDISGRKRAEAALKEQEELYRLLAENTLDVIWLMDMGLNFRYVNPAIEPQTGYTVEEFTGTPLQRYLNTEDFEKVFNIVQEYLENKIPDDGILIEIEIRCKDGSFLPMEVHGSIIYNSSCEPIGIQGTTREITERKKAEVEQLKLLAQIASLRRIDNMITSLAPVELGLAQVIQEVMNSLDVDAAAAMLITKADHRLRTVASLGFTYPSSVTIPVRVSEGYSGTAALEHQTISTENLQDPMSKFTRIEMAQAEGFYGYLACPMIIKGEVVGILEVFRRKTGLIPPDQIDFLNALAGQSAIVVNTLSTFQDLQISNEKLYLAYDANIEGWSRALDYRDKETEGHSRRVTDITLDLAEKLGVPKDQLRYIRWGALLHDIGKMGIPDSILRKPGKLTDEEWDIMKQHPTIARDLLRPIIYLEPAIDIPYCHHEHWDGSGYPRGLAGEDIPLAARIFAVADVWDALRSDRPYRDAWPEEKVVQYLKQISGKHLDPGSMDIFLRYWQDIPACNPSEYQNYH